MRGLTGFARLSNWPFALKMIFCPALAMLALLGLGLYSSSAIDTQATLIRAVVQRDLALALRLSGNATELQEINGLLYRLTTLRASDAPGLDVAREAAGLVARTSALADDMERLQPLAGVHEFPSRVKCATLAWHTLNAALADEAQERTATSE